MVMRWLRAFECSACRCDKQDYRLLSGTDLVISSYDPNGLQKHLDCTNASSICRSTLHFQLALLWTARVSLVGLVMASDVELMPQAIRH